MTIALVCILVPLAIVVAFLALSSRAKVVDDEGDEVADKGGLDPFPHCKSCGGYLDGNGRCGHCEPRRVA